MNLSWLCVCLCVVVVCVNAYCPNACSSPNGRCTDAEVCQCTDGWTGDDCSISDVSLTNNVQVDGHADTRQWKYFHILANSQQSSLEFQVNQTTDGGDLDAYVRLDKYPNRQEYDYRDISTSKKMIFQIPAPHGVYYLGVYGFLSSDFSVKAVLRTACPNDCSGHGSCAFNGVCTCRAGYMGADCSQTITVLQEQQPVVGEVAARQWVYYSIPNTQNTVAVTMTQLNVAEDCDLYVKFGTLPSLTDFDFRDTTTQQVSNLLISSARSGVYYVGIYGFSATSSFSIMARTYSECPNQCSGSTHGTCTPSFTCSCGRDYTGETCETKTTSMVLDGRVESGHVGGNMWNYYHFETFTTNNAVITMRQVNQDADCDVYIKRGENPTRFSFDYRDISYNTEVNLVIQNPADNVWYVGVYGYKTCDYQLSGVIALTCPNNCVDANHGTCVQGHCVCKDEWTSADCSVRSQLLRNGISQTSTIRNGVWQYFRFSAQVGTQITVVLSENVGMGNVWLFESQAGNPTLSAFDHSDTETNSPIHRVITTVPETAEIYVGVYGSILASTGVDYGFQIIAWQSRFD